MVKKYLFLFFVLFGCVETYQFTKQSFNSKELKINGFYYSVEVGKETDYVNLFFLYSNGIIYKGGSGTIPKNIRINSIKNDQFDKLLYKIDLSNSITNWGIFEVSKNRISYEMRYSRADAPVYKSNGIIMNDSTFVINSITKSDNTDKRIKNEVFHFRQFSPKPDSTNNFIK